MVGPTVGDDTHKNIKSSHISTCFWTVDVYSLLTIQILAEKSKGYDLPTPETF